MGCPKLHLPHKLSNFRALWDLSCKFYHPLMAFPEFTLQTHSWHGLAMPVNSLRAGSHGAAITSPEPGTTPQHLPNFNSELTEEHHGKCSAWWWWLLLFFFPLPLPSHTFLWDPWTRDVRLTESRLHWCIRRKKLLSSQLSRTQLSPDILDLHLGKTHRGWI